jgi:hypothetical protein
MQWLNYMEMSKINLALKCIRIIHTTMSGDCVCFVSRNRLSLPMTKLRILLNISKLKKTLFPNVEADLQSASPVELGFLILPRRIANPNSTEFRIANPERLVDDTSFYFYLIFNFLETKFLKKNNRDSQ